jgi:hypothetical protein
MNEQIAKLYEQAIIIEDGGDYVCGELDPVKFAELIVKECGVALTPMLRDMISRGQAYNLIKQHFGVEE